MSAPARAIIHITRHGRVFVDSSTSIYLPHPENYNELRLLLLLFL